IARLRTRHFRPPHRRRTAVSPVRRTFMLLALALLTAGLPWHARPAVADPARADDSPQQRKKGPPAAGRVYRNKVTAHWFADETKFWYRNDLKGGAKEFVLVDAEKGSRGPAF